MPENLSQNVLDKIKTHAVSRISTNQRERTNFSLDERVYERDEEFGPPNQRMRATRRTAVVFADDDPRANWGHACRYLLYDAETGRLIQEVAARLPSGHLKPFFQPIKPIIIDGNPRYWGPPRWRCPIILPERRRYALLYAGFTMNRHLNDLEFCYRMLVDQWGFDPADIFVYSFNGTLDTVDPSWFGTVGPPASWPGDGTPFRIKVNGPGTPTALAAFFSQMAATMKSDDMLFIHTNNHGDTDNTGAYLGYPASFPGGSDVDWSAQWVNLYASTFCGWLNSLPPYRALMVMMEQCGSGGFRTPVLTTSTAGQTTFSAACAAWTSSYVTSDGLWDGFAKEWIAAMAGENPNGSALPSDPDTDGSPYTDAIDAHDSAATYDPCTSDSPNFGSSGASANTMTFAQQYEFFWFWCWIIRSYAYDDFAKVPSRDDVAAYRQRLNAASPALRAAIAEKAEGALLNLRRELGDDIRPILKKISGN